jgi:arylsulfatase A-like enzyme
MMSAPGLSAATIDRPVSTVDIVPTAVALLGLEVPGHVDGVDLLADAVRPVFAARRGERAVRSGPWKLLQADPGAPPRLFDLAADPAEARDLAADRPDIVAELVTELAALETRRVFATPVDRGELDESTRDQLRALGYLSD